MSQDTLVTKPASGHWTDAHPEPGRGPVSLEDCVSEEFYEKEREHIFNKTWLYLGRVERVPRSGSYFTRELKFLNTSIIVVRGKDDVILRAFHNICPHRGNKLLWQDDPFEEVEGRAPLLYCRFHGWRYNLDGSLLAPTRKDLLLDFDPDSCRVPAIQCDVWEVHLHQPQPAQHRAAALIPRRAGARHRGLPVRRAAPGVSVQGRAGLATGRSSSTVSPRATTARCTSSFGNLTAEAKEALDKPNPFTDALAYQLKGPHRMFSFAGEPSRKTPYSKPIECVMEASAAGPWNKRNDRGPMPPGLNPTRSEKYGFDSFQFFPNFVLIFGASGFTTHTHWPTGPHSHIFEVEMFDQPPTTHKERLGQELTVTFLNDIILKTPARAKAYRRC